MAQQVFTGTWEEIAQHAAEFEGKQVKLILSPEEAAQDEETPSQEEIRARMMQILDEADALEKIPGPPLTDPYEAAWGAGVEEKARKQGLII